MPIKVAFIGAGSVGFTRELTRDILTVPELRDTHFAFHDINARNLDMLVQLCEKDIRENRLPARITPSLDRRRALADAKHRLAKARPLGTNQWKGAARLRPKSVQEMQAKAEEHRAHASASNRAAAPLAADAAVIRNKAGGSALEKVSGNGRKPVLSKVEHTPSKRQ